MYEPTNMVSRFSKKLKKEEKISKSLSTKMHKHSSTFVSSSMSAMTIFIEHQTRVITMLPNIAETPAIKTTTYTKKHILAFTVLVVRASKQKKISMKMATVQTMQKRR